MAIVSTLRNYIPELTIQSVAIYIPLLVFLFYFVPWLVDPHGVRSVPGPFIAKFSDIWLGWITGHGHRSEEVHEMHLKYGPIVRLAPNHISISDPSALQELYAHSNGTVKSNFYDAFVSIQRGLFNTRDRAQHSRKRKIVSHIFSMKNVIEFEPNVREYIGKLIGQWDRLCGQVEKEGNNARGNEGEGGWKGRDGRLWLDCLPWYNYLAFDIIGDLAFGSPFGMIEAAKDSAPVPSSIQAAMDSYSVQTNGSSKPAYETINIPAVQILNDRGEYSATMGALPPHWRPLAKQFLPWFRRGGKAVKNLAGIAVVAVAKRLSVDPSLEGVTAGTRTDLLSKLREGKDSDGRPMGREELTAEALTQLIAGSDTTSNSSCAITYHLATNQAAQAKLQAELDNAIGPISASSTGEELVATYAQVKSLPYLEACINEGLRIHSTSALGLPRIIPEGGLEVAGQQWKEGTVLSVPSYTIHRDVGVWGEDVDVYRPERWFERDKEEVAKTFNPFSYGPRACVGKNLANMELMLILGSILHRYHFVLEEPEKPLETCEGFLRKPLSCRVGIKKREI